MLNSKVVVITGAARGIGRYVARTFAESGAKVAVADILPLDNISAELRAMETETLAIQADIRDEEAVRAMMDSVVGRFGRIDVLVNNAGVPTHSMPSRPPVRDTDKALWDLVMDTNVGGTFLCTKHVLPYMEKQGEGHVINVFGGGNLGYPGAALYVASKAAVRTFTRFVAEEEREWNICIVAVSPGGQIATEDASEEVRLRVPGVEFVSNRFVLAAQVGMELSGHTLTLQDGRLAITE